MKINRINKKKIFFILLNEAWVENKPGRHDPPRLPE